MNAAAVEAGFVDPAYVWQPPRHHSLLPNVIKWCQLLGETLEPEQAYAVDVITGVAADGAPAAFEAAVICPRQNLKTFILERIVLTMLLDPRTDVRLIMWTSQELPTCDETFDRFRDWFEGVDDEGAPKHPYLAEMLDKDATGGGINLGKGTKELAVRVAGQRRRLRFRARSGKAGRGLSGDVLVFDEAFDLEAKHLGALLPTLATRRRATVFYGSSAGHGGSDVLRGVRDRGRPAGMGAPAYIEWCAPGALGSPGCKLPDCRHAVGTDGCSLDRREFWAMSNPMVGRIRADGNGTSWKKLEGFRAGMPPAEFAREFLGWFDSPDSAVLAPVTLEMWKSCDEVEDDPHRGIVDGSSVVFSPEIATDRKSGSIAVAGFRSDGSRYTELIEHDNGASWLLPRLRELATTWPLFEIMRGTGKTKKLCAGIILDPSSPAGGLIDDLRSDWIGADGIHHDGIEPVVMSPLEVRTAAGDLQDGLTLSDVWHPVQSEVESAIKGAIRRDLGDGGWSFGRARSAKELVEITPAVACTNAVWGLSCVEPEPDPNTAGAY